MSDTDTIQAEPDSYAAAITELEGIVSQLQRGIDDVDQIAAAAERSHFLLTWCQQRLGAATLRVRQLHSDDTVSDLDTN